MLTQMTTLMCPPEKYSIKSPSTMAPAGICMHETTGKASAMAEISYMVTNNNCVSYHYAVDDYRSVQGLPEDRISWNCGATWGNYHLIAVEICYSGIGGELYEKSVSNAAYLVAMLLHKYKWGLEKVTTHNAQNGKDCPHIQLSRGFNNFIKMVSNAYDDLFGNKQPTPAAPTIQKYPIPYNAHLVKLGWTDVKQDGEFIGDKAGKAEIDGVHIDTRKLPAGMQLKAAIVSGGTLKDYGIINNNTLIGVDNANNHIEQLEFTSINPPAGYDFWYRIYLNGQAQQWTNRKIGTVNTILKITGLQFRVCKLSELVN
ncbi:MAG: N-acetylmuramoyl-L-alanine amidase [Lachnospiraceae bacterium]|nr:N-acetylmuramoyl-L-alanine amidase [Lachnospiraceae bacterium]